MPKSELKIVPHYIHPEQNVVEVWYEEKLVATVYGSDGPGVRVISKHPMDIIRGGLRTPGNVIEVRIEPPVKEGSGG
jgi:hypothetical protein